MTTRWIILILSKVIKLSNSQVMAGPYKGTEFVVKSYWGSYDMSSKLLGSYERHIQEKIVEIKNKNNLEIIINIGAGEGYHIVSLIKNSQLARIWDAFAWVMKVALPTMTL